MGRQTNLCLFYQILEQVSPNPEEVHCGGALSNLERNRSNKFLPGKSMSTTQCILHDLHMSMSL